MQDVPIMKVKTKCTGKGALGTMNSKEPRVEWQDKLSATRVIKMSNSTQNFFRKKSSKLISQMNARGSAGIRIND